MAQGARLLGRDLLEFWGSAAGGLLRQAFTPLLAAFDRGFTAFAERYDRALVWALDRPRAVLGGAALALLVAVTTGLLLRRDLLPDVDQGAFEVRVVLPEGSGLEATAAATATVEAALRADPEVWRRCSAGSVGTRVLTVRGRRRLT